MKSLAVFCVNYNSYKELYDYVRSVDVAAGECSDIRVDVYVIDNTDKNYQPINISASHVNIKLFDHHMNYGYFGAVCHAIKEVNLDDYDYYVISNVDVLVDKDIFQKLVAQKYPENTGIIAPRIFSKHLLKNLNPVRLERYSYNRLKMLLFLNDHSVLNTFLLWLRKRIYRLRKSSNAAVEAEQMSKLYLAHGSFILLTKEFYKRCGLIDYPIFLYCEEIYLAELCRKHDLLTVYDGTLKLTDIGMVSTGHLKKKQFCKYNHDAITYIINTFYKNK